MQSKSLKQINSWKYKSISVYMDGGSISLIFDTPNGETREILLSQHVSSKYYAELSFIPSTLFINGQIIEKRSEAEKLIIKFLENICSNKVEKNCQELLYEKILYLKSKKHLQFVPTKLELSEKRKKYLNSKNNI